MDPLAAARGALVLATVASAIALIRLAMVRAYTDYPMLMVYVGAQFALGVAGLLLSPVSRVYRQIYLLSEPITWLISILMLREVYRRAFSVYPGISSLTRWATNVSVSVALVACVFVLWNSGPTGLLAPKTLVKYEVFVDQAVFFTLSAFIFLMFFLLSRYPIALSYNVAANISIFSINFLFGFLILHLFAGPEVSEQAWRNAGVAFLSACCFAAWAILLRPQDRDVLVRVRTGVNASEEERLLLQLELINKVLVKSGRG